MSEARKRVASMRTRTFDYVPYLATYIYAMKAVERKGLGTMAVDPHGNMYYDPDWVAKQSTEQGAYTVTHEVCHLIFRHHERAKEMYGDAPTKQQQLVCNVAADLVVEQALHQMRLHRPDGAVHLGMEYRSLGITLDFPPDLRMEEYYRLIMEKLKEQEDQQQGEQGEQSPDGGDQQQDGQGQPDGQSSGDGDPQPGEPGSGGSCADGVARDYEVQPDGSWESFGEDSAAAGAEKAIQEMEANGIGNVPGSLREAITSRRRAVRDPWGELRAAVASSVSAPIGGRQATYRRPSRRQPPNMMRLRGYTHTQPSCVVILDTSGSMFNEDDQAKAITCIAAGLRKLSRFKIVAGDTRIASRKDVSSITQVEWAGGGGTDMARIIEQVDKEDRPDSIVLVSDCYTGWPARQTRARLVVACTTSSDSAINSIPKWARTVVLAK